MITALRTDTEQEGGAKAGNLHYAVTSKAVLRELRKDWAPVFSRDTKKSWATFQDRYRDRIKRAPCRLAPLTFDELHREIQAMKTERAVAACGLAVAALAVAAWRRRRGGGGTLSP